VSKILFFTQLAAMKAFLMVLATESLYQKNGKQRGIGQNFYRFREIAANKYIDLIALLWCNKKYASV